MKTPEEKGKESRLSLSELNNGNWILFIIRGMEVF
jgi:hypothetical protein